MKYKEPKGASTPFFRFSAPPPVAALLTAFFGLAVIDSGRPAPGPAPAPIPAPTFASAVPSGDGEGCPSLVSLSGDKDEVVVRVAFGRVLEGEALSGRAAGAGEVDFRLTADITGSTRVGTVVEGGTGVRDGSGAADLGGEGDVMVVVAAMAEDDDGLSNSGGRMRGVACTLVISFARSQ